MNKSIDNQQVKEITSKKSIIIKYISIIIISTLLLFILLYVSDYHKKQLSCDFIGLWEYIIDKSITLFTSFAFILLLVSCMFKNSINSFIQKMKELSCGQFSISIQNNTSNNTMSDGLINDKDNCQLKEIDTKQEEKIVNSEKENNIPEETGEYATILKERKTQLKKRYNIQNPNKNEELLLKIICSAQLALEFEQIYISIFKTQMDALIFMNNNKKSSDNGIKRFYDSVYLHIVNPISFDLWLSYLTTNNLIQKDGEDFIITEKGHTFVFYILRERGYNVNLLRF